jgi:hypothetical protein
MDNPIVQWIIGLGISGAILTAVSAVARFWPKEKAIALADRLGTIIGKAITTFGNSRVGKKVWNKVEEGPITTALAFIMALCVRIGSVMVEDNNIKSIVPKKKIEPEVTKPVLNQ